MDIKGDGTARGKHLLYTRFSFVPPQHCVFLYFTQNFISVSCFDQKFMMAQKLQNEEISEYRSHSEVVNIFQDTVPTSISSNYRKYTKFLSTEEMEDKIAINKSLNKEPSEKDKSLSGKETGVQGDCIYPHINLFSLRKWCKYVDVSRFNLKECCKRGSNPPKETCYTYYWQKW